MRTSGGPARYVDAAAQSGSVTREDGSYLAKHFCQSHRVSPMDAGDLLGGVVAGRVKRRHRGKSDPFRTPNPDYR